MDKLQDICFDLSKLRYSEPDKRIFSMIYRRMMKFFVHVICVNSIETAVTWGNMQCPKRTDRPLTRFIGQIKRLTGWWVPKQWKNSCTWPTTEKAGANFPQCSKIGHNDAGNRTYWWGSCYISDKWYVFDYSYPRIIKQIQHSEQNTSQSFEILNKRANIDFRFRTWGLKKINKLLYIS